MKRFLALSLVSSLTMAAIGESESSALKTSISSGELNAQLATNVQREVFLKKELNQKVLLLSQIQNGASAPKYIWEEIPAAKRNRASLEKLLKLAIRRHLDEIHRIQQINTELTAQLDWMSHDVSTAKRAIGTPAPVETSPTETLPVETSSIAFKCGDVPVGFASLSEKPLMQDFGTRKDSLTGLEWNSLGWWIGQKPASPVRACRNGKVVFSGPMQGRGHVIMLDHGDEFLTIYANISPSTTSVKLGATLSTGEMLGHSQDSLYFEVRHRGKAVNPRLVFARQNLDILGL